MEEALHDFGMGRLPDYPDFRDSSFAGQNARLPEGEDREVPTLLQQLGAAEAADEETLASEIDLRPGFSPIGDFGRPHGNRCYDLPGLGVGLRRFGRDGS